MMTRIFNLKVRSPGPRPGPVPGAGRPGGYQAAAGVTVEHAAV